jgi:hypothetical protein
VASGGAWGGIGANGVGPSGNGAGSSARSSRGGSGGGGSGANPSGRAAGAWRVPPAAAAAGPGGTNDRETGRGGSSSGSSGGANSGNGAFGDALMSQFEALQAEVQDAARNLDRSQLEALGLVSDQVAQQQLPDSCQPHPSAALGRALCESMFAGCTPACLSACHILPALS